MKPGEYFVLSESGIIAKTAVEMAEFDDIRAAGIKTITQTQWHEEMSRRLADIGGYFQCGRYHDSEGYGLQEIPTIEINPEEYKRLKAKIEKVKD
ncbi:MAG: hypothetical protein V2A34_00270 [Lentisphaerota bacterium]